MRLYEIRTHTVNGRVNLLMLTTILITFGIVSVVISTILVYSCCVIGAGSWRLEEEDQMIKDINIQAHLIEKKPDASRPSTQQLGEFVAT